MIPFKKKQDDDEYLFETRDILIAFDLDKRTSDICTITAIDHESVIVAGKYKVPLDDCEVTTGVDGRNFFYKAPTEYITETRRLAELEQSMVLSQITAYNPPTMPSSMDWLKITLFFVLFVCVIGLIIK
ncbi:hypothetical protein [Lysinibacillus fusiformis]|uniref:hypothetical protein n=1 Tax=Lysinibacillus fusiformis TaxID=28031 RepID=UPI003CFE5F47